MYFPKSQIKTNLYSNGEYLYLDTNESYIGSYYKISTGQTFTGKSPDNPPNIEIILDPDIIVVNNKIINIDSSGQPSQTKITYIEPEFFSANQKYISPILIERFLPLFNQVTPSQQDYTLGSFTRYFCKKTNELKYIEINKETHDKLKIKDTQIAWDLYEPQFIVWQINGDREGTFLANKNNIALLEKRQKWYGFSQYLKEDYLKYYLAS
jgi:hypothetical protein